MRKKIFLLRHGQSEDNVSFGHFCKSIALARTFKLPSWHRMLKGLRFLRCEVDPPLSITGKRQIAEMRMLLRDDKFWENVSADVIVYSPLKRACDTATKLLPESNWIPCISLPYLREVSPLENLLPSTFMSRVQQFESWLETSTAQTLVVVGHCQYFRFLLNDTDMFMRNCDVWEVDAFFGDDDSVAGTRRPGSRITWANLHLLHRSSLSRTHPWDRYFGQGRRCELSDDEDSEDECSGEGQGTTSSSRIEEEEDNDLQENVPKCRICFMSQQEFPNASLIKPCRCTGSQAFVHLRCLNEWRATSTQAQNRCSVCQYEYKVKKSQLASFLSSETGAAVISIGLLLIGVICLGWVSDVLVRSFLNLDGAYFLYSIASVQPYNSRFDVFVCPFVLQLNIQSLFLERQLGLNYLACLGHRAVDVLSLGLVGLACFGLLQFAATSLIRGGQAMGGVAFFVLNAFCFRTNELTRLLCLAGVTVGVKTVYEYVLKNGRKIAQAIGEQIEEYEFH